MAPGLRLQHRSSSSLLRRMPVRGEYTIAPKLRGEGRLRGRLPLPGGPSPAVRAPHFIIISKDICIVFREREGEGERARIIRDGENHGLAAPARLLLVGMEPATQAGVLMGN